MTQAKQHYGGEFERVEGMLPGAALPWLCAWRREALNSFKERGFPSARDERWKYTRTSAIEKRDFTMVKSETIPGGDMTLPDFPIKGDDAYSLVFVDGVYCPRLSRIESLPAGVTVASLAEMLGDHGEVVRPFLEQSRDFGLHPFSALNAAFMGDGAYIHMSDDTIMDKPIQLLFIATEQLDGSMIHPRNLLVVGENCQVVVLENYLGYGEASYFANIVTEIMAGNNAVVEHIKLQQQTIKAYHIDNVHVRQRGNSRYTCHSVSLGGALVRNDIDAVFEGEECECVLNGLYMVSGRQHVDNHTRIDHAKPHCTSHEYYRGILDGHSRGVFNGKVVVHQDAQKTDAQQANHNLLLSDHAEIDTKPELEIYADDVKCAHGATVGQLDEDAIFYLRSRGIQEPAARSVITFAFARELIDRINIESLRTCLEDIIIARLPQGNLVKELI